MKVLRALFGIMLCITLISSFSPLFALSNRPQTQHDEQGNFIPNPFAEGDALRYGGLFGPLPDPYEDSSIQGALSFYDARVGFRKGIFVRDMGFEKDPDHYVPITRSRSN